MPRSSTKTTRTPTRRQTAPVKKRAVLRRVVRPTTASAMATLLDVMTQSDKDHVRVSAAKIILARLAAQEEKKMRTTKRQRDDEPARQAALDAIAQLLDELAAAKTAGAASAAAMVADGTATTDHARR